MANKTTTLPNALFSCGKQPLAGLRGGKEKTTGTAGPMGIGRCDDKFRKGAQSPSKYSAVAIAADAMLIHNSVNAVNGDNSVYGEYTDNEGKNYRFLCTEGTHVDYQGERLHGAVGILPFVLYALRNDTDIPEFQDAFAAVKEQVSIDGTYDIPEILVLCDLFYYGVARQCPSEVVIEENNLQIETVQAAIRSGLLSPMKVLDKIQCPEFTGITIDKKEKDSKKKRTSEFDSVKNGENIIAFDWNDEQKSHIPSLTSLENFVPSPTFYSVLNKIQNKMQNVICRLDAGLTGVDAIGKDYVNLFITGKPGTGKTTLAYALGAATGMPTYTVAMTKNTEEDVFQGMNKVIDGQLQFVSTDFLDAYTNGGIIILEEINLPDPSVVMGAIGQAVEFPFVLMCDGYKPVKRHPLCVIIGTMNIGTYGSKSVNQALSSRFRQSYILADPTKESFIDILCKTGSKKKESTWVYNAYDKIISYLKSPSVNAEDVCLNVTLRGCIGALENISEGEDGKEAIRNTLIGKISEVDLELAEDVYNNVVATLPDLY